MAYRVGWLKHKRIHFCLVHIDIRDDMVIIQANNTEDPIDEDLMAQGVPSDKICLGLLPPDVREYRAQLSPHVQCIPGHMLASQASAQIAQGGETRGS
jgi:hypothetical protein